MRYAFIVICAFILTGCAHDNYTGPKATMAADLHACKWDVSQKFFARKDSDAPMIMGGILAGALGGAIMGAATAASNSGDGAGTSAQFDAMMEQCMAAKGYSGTSDD